MINLKRLKKIWCNLIPILLVFFFFFSPCLVFSQTTGEQAEGLELVLGRVVWFFTSNYVKAICMIALAGLATGLLMNRGEPGIIKKFLPWIAGVMLLRSIGGIVVIFINFVK